MTKKLLAALVAAVAIAAMFPSQALADDDPLTFEGHGWGHGRGMGQYGALGYALDHGWSYAQILSHFYGNTSMGNIGNPEITVRLTKFDGLDTLVQQEKGHLLTNAAPGEFFALRAQRLSSNTFRVQKASTCAGPWTTINASMTGPVSFVPKFNPTDERTEMIQVCESAPIASRWLRGKVRTVEGGGIRTINVLPMESYLRGVVPRESPASWGSLGSGKGMHALRAQAVAARSYARSENRYPYAKTCDTTSCQVYKGRAVQDSSGFRDLEAANTNKAISDTAGEVRMRSGTVQRTEFSSSTGGWSAGGTFPAVKDVGDSISSNPNHDWTVSIPRSSFSGVWREIGTHKQVNIGTFERLEILKRNGLGDWGGRVLEARVTGSAGSVIVSGDEVRLKLGLKSNWFNIAYSGGYWLTSTKGAVYTFGSATYYGGASRIALAASILGIEALPSGGGYWLVASDGGIFSYGAAKFYGSTGSMKLNKPVVGMASTPSGKGYWLVASDGGIFSFGDAKFYGSTGSMKLNKPIIGMSPTKTSNGYWLVASDGGLFAFGDAKFYGSTGSMKLNSPVVGMGLSSQGGGYWIAEADGDIYPFGDAPDLGGAKNADGFAGIATK